MSTEYTLAGFMLLVAVYAIVLWQHDGIQERRLKIYEERIAYLEKEVCDMITRF